MKPHERVVREIVAAAASDDAPGLKRMLHPGVVLTVDGGGIVAAPSTALSGASEVAAYLGPLLSDPAASLRIESVNGMPGVVVRRDGAPTGVLCLAVRGGRVREAWLVVNPEKLAGWG